MSEPLRGAERPAPTRGMTLVEVTISSTILAIVMVAMVVGVQREAEGLSEMVEDGTRERQTQELLQKIESSLEFAAAAPPRAILTTAFDGGSAMSLDTSLGFPPQGALLVDPGTAFEERLEYRGIHPVAHRLLITEPGTQCTAPRGHAVGASVIWSGAAFAIENQTNPFPTQYEGIANSPTGAVYFRGNGTGFSYRVPTDPAGGSDFFDVNGVRWGASVAGTPTTEGWSAMSWESRAEVTELQLGMDLNGDGDPDDTFELGALVSVSWNAFTPDVPPTLVRLCPPIILQERCNHGGDLDGDGDADPIFLWNGLESSLTVRMTILKGEVGGRTQLERLRTTIFLRNGEVD